jgi:peptidoglycan hydrolase-like protein with peptidoglycan-binding domain
MGTGVGRVAGVVMISGVLVGTSALGYAVASAGTGHAPDLGAVTQLLDRPSSATPAPAPARTTSSAASPAPVQPSTTVAPPEAPARRAAPTPTAKPVPVVPKPGKRILGPGDKGPQVRALQARLRQIAWFSGDVTDSYGSQTTTAVKGFQAKRGIAVTGYVDRRTMRRLVAMTHTPTTAELQNKITPMGNVPGKLDARCLTGRTLCVDKSSRTLRWVIDGKVVKTLDVRFGSTVNNTPTREGLFHVGWKSRDHVSKLYDSPMPYAMFFSGGQAVHYSSDFAARGYAGASHGCVNVRDLAGIRWLFDQVRVGDKVVVYWS